MVHGNENLLMLGAYILFIFHEKIFFQLLAGHDEEPHLYAGLAKLGELLQPDVLPNGELFELEMQAVQSAVPLGGVPLNLQCPVGGLVGRDVRRGVFLCVPTPTPSGRG